MKGTTIALAAGTAVAGAALSLRARMRHRADLSLRVPGYLVLERITGGVDPAGGQVATPQPRQPKPAPRRTG